MSLKCPSVLQTNVAGLRLGWSCRGYPASHPPTAAHITPAYATPPAHATPAYATPPRACHATIVFVTPLHNTAALSTLHPAEQAHEAEQPDLLRPLTVPLLNAVQGGLRKYGQPVFDALANPSTVKTILKEPYADAEQVATGWTYSLG